MHKALKFMLCAGMAAVLAPQGALLAVDANADTTPNPVISRNCPAYSLKNPSTAAAANDEHYFSFWNGSVEDYIAYDLSGVPESERKIVDAVWYNTSSYDAIGNYVSRNMEPSDYTIEVNAADGGVYPEDGWEVVETVTDNTLSSRQHIVNMEGYNWIRMNITGVDGKTEGTVMVNFDIHNVSDGIDDSWIFFGDSITAGGMNNCYGTGFATYINGFDENYFPIQENGGIGGIRSTDGLENIDRWLSTFPGKYVSIAYGTNDAWGNQTGAQKYYENTVAMIEKVIAAGKVPVLPTIPFSTEPGVAEYLEEYEAMIYKIWEEDPRVVHGPDFYQIIQEHTEYLSSDGVHPCSEGYEEMRHIWAVTMYLNVYKPMQTDKPSGDVNADHFFSVADVVMTQNWLLNNGEMTDWHEADVVNDDVINIYDLCEMRAMLAESYHNIIT